MFDKERREERKRVRGITPVHKARKNNFANTKQDRRSLIAVGSLAVVILGFAIVGINETFGGDDKDDKPAPPTTAPEQKPSGLTDDIPCDVSNMQADPLQTGYLQEFLQAEGHYDGPVDQTYSAAVISAVAEFQAEAQVRGEYSHPIDGRAGPYTCEAMVAAGAEHFIVD